jgi:Porphyromonas-type peptidyl-arginine deiminase
MNARSSRGRHDGRSGDRHRARALEEYRALIAAIARFEPVAVIADPALAAEAADACDGIAGADVLPIPIDDSWIRDSGPIYLVDDRGGVAMTQLGFNAWGEKYAPRWSRRRRAGTCCRSCSTGSSAAAARRRSRCTRPAWTSTRSSRGCRAWAAPC